MRGSGFAQQLFPVQETQGLEFPGFNLLNATEGVSILQPQSQPNYATSFTARQVVQGGSAKITTAGTATKSFTLSSNANGCVASTQAGQKSQSCTIKYTGVKTDGTVVTHSCDFKAGLLDLASQMAICTFPKGFTDLREVEVFPVKADLTPLSTVVCMDSVRGTTFS